MDRKALMALWPSNADDVEAATRLVAHGPDALGPVMADMVSWMRTTGSVKPVFVDALAQAGSRALEPIRAALGGTHEFQVHALLAEVLPRWSASDLSLLSRELEAFLQRGSLTGLNVLALALLQQAQIPIHAPVEEWSGLFRRRLAEQIARLDEIDRASASDPTS